MGGCIFIDHDLKRNKEQKKTSSLPQSTDTERMCICFEYADSQSSLLLY